MAFCGKTQEFATMAQICILRQPQNIYSLNYAAVVGWLGFDSTFNTIQVISHP